MEKKFMYLFCYGSNNPDQLAERLEREVEVFPAYVNDYQRVYRGYSQKWGGGVGALKKMKGHQCFGLVVEVDKNDIELMDVYEGYPDFTSKKMIDGFVSDKKSKMMIYSSTKTDWHVPSKAYLQAVFKTVSTFWEVDSYKDFYNEY
jgi:hypothetical protein